MSSWGNIFEMYRDQIRRAADAQAQGQTPFGASLGGSVRTVGGGQSGGRASTNGNDAAARQWAQGNFGAMASYLNHPELGPILLKAGREQATATQAAAMLQGTSWFQQRSEAQRQYDFALQGDPAQLQHMREGQAALVGNLAKAMGIEGELDLAWVTDMSLRNGLTKEELGDLLANSVTMDTTKRGGAAQMIMSNVKSTAADYYVKLDDQTALGFTKRMLSDEMDVEAFRAWAQQQAKAQYTHLSDVLDKGVTLKEHFYGTQQNIAELLEVNVEDIDIMNDPKWHAVTGVNDNGKTRTMTAYEVADLARKDERWGKTDNAKQLGNQLVGTIKQAWGMR